MFENETLVNNLKRIGEKNTHNIILKVDAVDLAKMTITGTEISSNIQFFDVRIKSISDAVITDSFILIPKVGSFVYCTTVNNEQSNLQVVAVSQVDNVYLAGDSNLGIPKVTELKNQIVRLENKVNDLITALIAHVHAETGATTAVSASLAGFPTITPLTTIADLENPKVKH